MIKVKQLKDDAIVDVKVNKAYYIMAKKALYYLFTLKQKDLANREEELKSIIEKPYEELDDYGQAFQTLTRLLGEIESKAEAQDLFETKEIAEPGDDNYVEPTQD
jgi:hypothetical protein